MRAFRLHRSSILALALVVGVGFPSCGKRDASVKIFEISGTPAERAAKLEAFLLKHTPTLPGSISDAWLIEEQTGDGNLGPPDFSLFAAFTVPIGDLEKWTVMLAPLESHNQSVVFSRPGKTPCPWWLQASDFNRLKLHSPHSLTGRNHGWIAVDERTGRIFLHAFTM